MGGAALFNLGRKAINSQWVVLTVALLVRLIVLWEIVPHLRASGYFEHNEPTRIAWAMVSGYGFSSPWPGNPLLPTAQQPPLYPLLIAAIFKLAGPYSDLSVGIATALNAVFSALTGLAIMQAGRRMLGHSAGILAAWAWAVSPYEAIVSARVWESCLSGLLLMLMLWLTLALRDSESYRLWALYGVLAGVSVLNNPALLPVFTFIVVWLWIVRGRSRIPHIVTCVLVCLLTLVPWTLRNYSTFQRIIPVRDNFGFELWVGNHAGTPRNPTEFPPTGEIAFMDAKRNEAITFILGDPQAFVRRCAQRVFRFWTNPDPMVWFPISALAWIGAVLVVLRRRAEAVPCVVVLLVFPVVYYITHPGITYRQPIEPVIALLGIYTVTTMLERMGLSTARIFISGQSGHSH